MTNTDQAIFDKVYRKINKFSNQITLNKEAAETIEDRKAFVVSMCELYVNALKIIDIICQLFRTECSEMTLYTLKFHLDMLERCKKEFYTHMNPVLKKIRNPFDKLYDELDSMLEQLETRYQGMGCYLLEILDRLSMLEHYVRFEDRDVDGQSRNEITDNINKLKLAFIELCARDNDQQISTIYNKYWLDNVYVYLNNIKITANRIQKESLIHTESIEFLKSTSRLLKKLRF